jgi:SEC-C motif domain protein
MNKCPCDSKKDYEDCCEPYISGQLLPPSPEALMRSRYTAYSQANITYIANTMKGKASHNFNQEEAYQWAKQSTWLGLQILKAPPISTQDNIGFVEFVAHYQFQGKKQYIHEISKFHKEKNKWYYVAGKGGKGTASLHATR